MKDVASELINFFDQSSSFLLIGFDQPEYRPIEGVVIQHGHGHDLPNDITLEDNFAKDADGEEFFIPPWGSYYVARVINRFKVERRHVASVRPIKRFIINGLIYDFYFTCRFLLANVVYYIMVRFIYLFKTKKSLKALWDLIQMELNLNDGEVSVSDFLSLIQRIRFLLLATLTNPNIGKYPQGKFILTPAPGRICITWILVGQKLIAH